MTHCPVSFAILCGGQNTPAMRFWQAAWPTSGVIDTCTDCVEHPDQVASVTAASPTLVHVNA
jgi:hypothetical protein